MGNDAAKEIEPETRKLRQHASFVGNAFRHDHVERRKAVGGDDQEPVSGNFVDVADLTARKQRHAGEVRLKNWWVACQLSHGSRAEPILEQVRSLSTGKSVRIFWRQQGREQSEKSS